MSSRKKISTEFDDIAPGVSPDEQETGARRTQQIVLGVILSIAGIAMMVLPGPGVAVLVVGLNMIKPDNALVRWIRRKVPGIPEEGSVPRGAIVLGVGLMVISTIIGILYGDRIYNWFSSWLPII